MNTGNFLITAGIAALALGLILKFAPWLLNWFGRLPGDIRIQNEHSSVFIPITSMLVTSLILSLIVNFLVRK